MNLYSDRPFMDRWVGWCRERGLDRTRAWQAGFIVLAAMPADARDAVFGALAAWIDGGYAGDPPDIWPVLVAMSGVDHRHKSSSDYGHQRRLRAAEG